MTVFSSPVVKVEVNGARGASFADIARRTEAFDVLPTDNDRAVLDKFANYAIEQNPGFQSIIPGPAGPTLVTLATFRAAPSSNRKQALKVPGIPSGDFYFETTNPPYVDDGVNTIKANDTALSVGAWVRQGADGFSYKSLGAGAVLRDGQGKSRESVSVNDFGAKGDGVTDDTAAVNRAVLAVALRGGGEVIFGASASGYKITGTMLVATGIKVNLNGQRIIGPGSLSGTAFKTASLINGSLVPNADDLNNQFPSPSKIVRFAQISNGYFSNFGLVFDLVSFEYGCSLRDIDTENCNRVFKGQRCFYSKVINVSARGFSDADKPTYHFVGENNAIVLQGVSAVTELPILLEGGTTAFTISGCTLEGGGKGLKIKGDCLGLTITGCYFENIPGVALDLTEAAACSFDIQANYFNLCDVVFDDGATSGATRPLSGVFGKTNKISNPQAAPARSLMRVSGALNFVEFILPDSNQNELSIPGNWITSQSSRVTLCSTFEGGGNLDVRARSVTHAGVIPVVRSGDVGDTANGRVIGGTLSYPASASSTATIDTKIVWRTRALRAYYVLEITEVGVGTSYIGGDIWGPVVRSGDAVGKAVTISNNGGFLRISIAGLNNSDGTKTISGQVGILC